MAEPAQNQPSDPAWRRVRQAFEMVRAEPLLRPDPFQPVASPKSYVRWPTAFR